MHQIISCEEWLHAYQYVGDVFIYDSIFQSRKRNIPPYIQEVKEILALNQVEEKKIALDRNTLYHCSFLWQAFDFG